MTAHAHKRIPKAVLAEIIELAYGAGIGPQQIAAMTGYHAHYINDYGRSLGFTLGRGTKRKRPIIEDIPPRLAVLVMEYGPRL